ncbi:DegT/DnrJ/EryC1/StrS family aminotransferase [Morganella morganii]|nr:DegT/DnrJ/EryC1/StrS family aminotransferase [Morganella morganii]EKW3940656.1 DegT/DnrJ/EryC1/StrS family aminotransferase [Morganella morganii]
MITKKPININNYTKKYIFTKNARAAWKGVIDSIKTKNTTLLLPSYIGRNDKEGSGVYDAILFSNVSAEFYKLNDDLSVNKTDFEEKIRTLNIDAALVIHYFGFCRSDMDFIKKTCKAKNTLLIEDCAHAFNLFTNSKIGTYGDFSFYSIHKYLPSKSGGILHVNNGYYEEQINNTPIESIDINDLKIFAVSDLPAIYEKRRQNYLLYQKYFENKKYLIQLYTLSNMDNPQTFPILIKNNLREKLYFHLIEKNIITIALYYRLIDEIDTELYSNTKSISNNILNLPVHQDITECEINSICKEVDDYLNTNNI